MSPPRPSPRIVTMGILLGIVLALTYRFLALDPAGQPLRPPPPATTAIYDRHGVLLYEELDPELGKASYVPLRDLPAHLHHGTAPTQDGPAHPGARRQLQRGRHPDPLRRSREHHEARPRALPIGSGYIYEDVVVPQCS